MAIETPTTNRRGFLKRAAAIAPAVAIPTLPVLAAGPVEDPALLAWGDKVEALAAAYTVALQRRKEAIVLYHSLCPVPEELVATREDWRLFGFCGSQERDWAGNLVAPTKQQGRDILRLGELEELLADYPPRSKRARILRRKLAIAKGYDQAKKDAEAASGVRAAQRVYGEAQGALEDAMKAGQDLTPHTLAGVGAKARAILAYARAVGGNGLSWVSMVYGDALAADVVRLTAES